MKEVLIMYYWMHKEYGHIVPENRLMEDAIELQLDDVTDPTSCEYLNFSLYYAKTFLRVEWFQPQAF